MAENGQGQAQAQPVPDTNTGIFTWLNIRWFFAELLSKTMLLIGSLTSATGGFKGIPILLTLYPLNLFAIPSAVITVLCLISALSGFTVFWSSYTESLTPYCYKFIDFIKNLFTWNWAGDKDSETIHSGNNRDYKSIIEQLNEQLSLLSTRLLAEQEKKKVLSESVRRYLNQIGSLQGTSQYTILSQKISEADNYHRDHHEPQQSNPETLTADTATIDDLAYFIYYGLQLLVKGISILFVLFGSLVVIGIGILTNQGFLDYASIPYSGFAMLFCVIAAIMKQVCQLSFGAEKQFNTICSFFRWFGIHIENEEDRKCSRKQQELETKNNELSIQLDIISKLEAIEKELAFYHDIDNKKLKIHTQLHSPQLNEQSRSLYVTELDLYNTFNDETMNSMLQMPITFLRAAQEDQEAQKALGANWPKLSLDLLQELHTDMLNNISQKRTLLAESLNQTIRLD